MYINFEELEPPLMLAKFQDHKMFVLQKKIFKGFTIYGRCGNLGHVTVTIYTIPIEAPNKI